jgi:hypothetical protein
MRLLYQTTAWRIAGRQSKNPWIEFTIHSFLNFVLDLLCFVPWMGRYNDFNSLGIFLYPTRKHIWPAVPLPFCDHRIFGCLRLVSFLLLLL